MKNFKKVTAAIAATLMAATMVAPMALNSFAAEGDEAGVVAEANGTTTFNLEIPNLPEGAIIDNIRAVKIFNGTYDDGLFAVDSYGSDVTDDLKLALTKVLKADATEAMDASELAIALSKDTDNKATAFAQAAANALKDVTGEAGELNGNIVTFDDLGVGYYVVLCDAVGAEGDNNKAVSLGMLTSTGMDNKNVGTGTAKIGLPTVDKKIEENQETNTANAGKAQYESEANNWNDVGDYNIGESVPFKLYGTLPQNLSDYDTYFYQFNDSLGKEFDIASDATITVKIDGEEITEGYTAIVTSGNGTAASTIQVTFNDIRDIEGVTEDSLVTVEYNAVLSSRAEVGLPGQQNEVYLIYSNNPNNSGEGNNDKGETPKKKVIAFTYAVEFEKTFWNGEAPLTPDEIENKTYKNLRFTLTDKSNTTISVVKAPDADTEWDYYIAGEGDTPVDDGMELTLVEDKLVIRIKGLDEGEYKIVESGAEEIGYNNVTSDVNITALTVNTQDWDEVPADALTQFEYKFGEAATVTQTKDAGDITGVAKGEVKNKTGISLPSTGGIGTTLFYLGGGAMVAVAGVFLITKKRMKKEEA